MNAISQLIKTFPFFLFLLSGTLSAQQNEEKRVEEAIEKLRLAMVTPDQSTLNRLIHDQLSYGHSSGKVEDKKSFIESLLSGASDFVDITLSDQQITITGNTAMVRHTLSAATNDAGKSPGTVKLSVFTIWHREKGAWILLGRQAVKI